MRITNNDDAAGGNTGPPLVQSLTGSELYCANISNEARTHWRWFIGMGIAFIALGFMAFGSLIIASTVSIYNVGALMLVGAASNVIHALRLQTWPSLLGWLLSGLFYGDSGIITLVNPELTAQFLTSILAFTLVGAGGVRIWASFQLRLQSRWFWVMASGVVTIMAGIMLAFIWPSQAVWLFGLLLAFDLTFQGLATTALGLSMKTCHQDSLKQ